MSDYMFPLGRREEFDPRSRNFPLRATIRKLAKTRSYTWKCNLTLDQGTEGSCVGHAWAHELIARPAEVPNVGHPTAVQIYKSAQDLDPWRKEQHEGSSILAGAKATMLTGLIGGYAWTFSLDELIMGVGHRGPAVVGTNWYEGMFYPDAYGRIFITGSVAGGHAYVIRAVNIRKQLFTIRNSWGPKWGLNGDCYISFTEMGRLLRENGEACFALGRRTSAAFTPIEEG